MTSDLAFFQAAPIHYVDVGTKLAYRVFGSGPAIVLLHGWPFNGATYRSMVRRLSRNYTCYVPDLPGAGDSPWDPRTRDLFPDLGALVVRFVDALDLSRFALIAHDSGGGIARFAAAQLGDRVALLVLTDTEVVGYTPPLILLYLMMARVSWLQSVMLMLVRQRWFRVSPLGFGGLFAKADYGEGEFHQAVTLPFLTHFDDYLRALRTANMKTLDQQLPDIHRRISAPTLLVWGQADRHFPVERARAMSTQFRNLRAFVALPGQALMVHEEAPELVLQHIEPALNDLLSSPSPTVAISA